MLEVLATLFRDPDGVELQNCTHLNKELLIGPEDVRWKRGEDAHRMTAIVLALRSGFLIFYPSALQTQNIL